MEPPWAEGEPVARLRGVLPQSPQGRAHHAHHHGVVVRLHVAARSVGEGVEAPQDDLPQEPLQETGLLRTERPRRDEGHVEPREAVFLFPPRLAILRFD